MSPHQLLVLAECAADWLSQEHTSGERPGWLCHKIPQRGNMIVSLSFSSLLSVKSSSIECFKFDLFLHFQPVVYMEMKFPKEYPMAPPFVRVVRPRFKFLTGKSPFHTGYVLMIYTLVQSCKIFNVHIADRSRNHRWQCVHGNVNPQWLATYKWHWGITLTWDNSFLLFDKHGKIESLVILGLQNAHSIKSTECL